MPEDPSQSPHLSVSIVLHHSPLHALQTLLESLSRAALYACDGGTVESVRVALIDNSCDQRYRGQVERLLSDWDNEGSIALTYLPQPKNRGFGHAHNTVLEQLSGDFHLVLNPDVVLEEAALHAGLSALLADDDIVVLSPRVTGRTGEQAFLCKRYPSVLVLMLRGFAPAFLRRWCDSRLADYEMRDICAGEARAPVAIAGGCCMLLRTADWQAMGGFDERFFLYFEDFDLSLRMAQRGSVVFDPAMRISHTGGYAARKGLRHMLYFVRSAALFFRLHGWRWL